MTNDYIKKIQETSYFIEFIGKASALLQNSDKLFIVSDYSVHTGNYREEAILIPECLITEFKQKFNAYLVHSYNKYVKELKEIEL